MSNSPNPNNVHTNTHTNQQGTGLPTAFPEVATMDLCNDDEDAINAGLVQSFVTMMGVGYVSD